MDIKDLVTYLLTPVAQVALIMALAEVAKRIGLKTKWIPLLDLALGIVAGLMIYTAHLGYSPVEGVVVGIACGLSACGLFSGVKNLIEK
jgi:hypothetical protein